MTPKRTPCKRTPVQAMRIPLVLVAVWIAVLAVPSKGAGEAVYDPERLVGRWLRPDGGYVIEVMNVDADGSLQAAYFNPRPVNVSQAKITQKSPRIKIFIELYDVGYPKATYALTYDEQRDRLTGQYYQPAVGQTFAVEFTRMP